ncbi:hypothetical protein CW712_05960 [Candidatus Bathyarchaeota archaeon]|nr:MAG: hypothetical protein CW712_05960 [Candidatus Bathyarchaeota archaeon]
MITLIKRLCKKTFKLCQQYSTKSLCKLFHLIGTIRTFLMKKNMKKAALVDKNGEVMAQKHEEGRKRSSE